MTADAFAFGWAGHSGAAPPFTPLSLPGLLAWYDASMNVTQSSGNVTKWGDSSGSGDSNRDANGSSGQYPTLVSSDSTFNHQNSIDFASAGSQFLLTGTWSVPPTQPFTIWCVGTNDGGGSSQAMWYDSLTLGAQVTLFGPGSGGVVDVFAGGSTFGVSQVTTSPLVMLVEFNGASSNLFINNHSTAVASGSGGTNTIGGLTIGSASGGVGTTYLDGKISNIGVCQGILSTANKGNLFTWLGTKYGISVT